MRRVVPVVKVVLAKREHSGRAPDFLVVLLPVATTVTESER